MWSVIENFGMLLADLTGWFRAMGFDDSPVVTPSYVVNDEILQAKIRWCKILNLSGIKIGRIYFHVVDDFTRFFCCPKGKIMID